jgi:folate-binding protein YgfZ
MSDLEAVFLDHRAPLTVGGADTRSFLQGLISNDINKVAPTRAVYATLLTAHGKFLHEFFIADWPEAGANGVVIDAERERLTDLERRLTLYRLRAKVAIAVAAERFAVVALLGPEAPAAIGLDAQPGAAIAFGGGIAYVDPRLPAMGARAILPRASAGAALAAAGFAAGPIPAYDRLRLAHGLPDGSRDIAVERYFPLECGFEELNAIDYQKGCYVGQELTARTHYRGTIRKRLLPVAVEGPLPPPGTPIKLGGREAGEVRSGLDRRAIAMMRLDDVEEAAAKGLVLTAADARVRPQVPAWVRLAPAKVS